MKILVIEAGGLHLGYLGCYGNHWVGSPNIDQLATEGIVADWHFADQPELHLETPWHQRSVGTGNYTLPGTQATGPTLTGTPRIVTCMSLDTFARDVCAALAANDRWLWIEGPNLVPPWKLDDELLDGYFDEEELVEGMSGWIDPPLAFAQLTDAEILELQNTYAAVVTFFDAQLGAILDHLRSTNQLDEMIVCITARSSLPLGEHGMIGAPRPLLHDELVHVPLLFRLPKAQDAGLRIAALTQPVDLLPTFLEALHEPIPSMHGHSLWPLIRGDVEALRPFVFAALRVDGRENWLMRTLEWVLQLAISQPPGEAPQLPLLYVKPEDRWEVNNLYQHRLESADEMAKTLHAFAATLGNR